MARELAAHPCGECSVCCSVIQVPELGKPPGLPCTRLRYDGQGRCGVHRTRPASCREFECAWRLGLAGGAARRPDKLGILFTFEDTHATGMLLLVARETKPGALDAQMGLLHELAGKGYVLYLIDHPEGVERCRMMGPEERVKAIKEAARKRLPLVSQ